MIRVRVRVRVRVGDSGSGQGQLFRVRGLGGLGSGGSGPDSGSGSEVRVRVRVRIGFGFGLLIGWFTLWSAGSEARRLGGSGLRGFQVVWLMPAVVPATQSGQHPCLPGSRCMVSRLG